MQLCTARRAPAPCAPIALALLIALFAAPPAGAVAMGDLHCNDASGVPAAPYIIGTPVSVTGVVTVATGSYAASFTDIYMTDGTGGIEVYNPGIPTTFALGDSFTVNGTLSQYRGNTQITMSGYTWHASGLPVPQPLVLTCWDVAHSFGPDYCEPNESKLIRLNHVTHAGSWVGGGTLTLSDSTGSCTLYIDADTGVQNIPAPTGPFDIIGILKQYDTALPYTSGYEILPRGPADIILPGPTITSGPVEPDIQDDQVTIVWTTDVPGTSRVDYGLTPSYETGTVEDPTLVTEHQITLPGLIAASIYHYQVTTSDGQGTTQTVDRLFCSGSGPEVTGEIRVYFNKSVDTSLALGVPAQGYVNLMSKLVERIDAAQYSIDVCLYSFDLAGPADALMAAYDRGVSVRFITTVRTTVQTQIQRLIDHGIPVIDAGFGSNPGSELMHNKFWVFDHRGGSPDGSDDWVSTGSHNVTSEGTYTDIQNVIEVQDAALATAYTAEFEEMWGSSTDVPDPVLSRFGSRKLDNTPKRFNVNGVPMLLYFSPSDNSIRAAITEVQQAEYSVHFCILSFTRSDLAAAMQNNWYYTPGFELRGVFDSAEGSSPYSVYADMKGIGDTPWDPPADVWLDSEAGSLHHKYMIIDANRAGVEPTVITGSTNWSNSGNDDNDENMLIVKDFSVANQYFQEFAQRYHAAGGSGDLTVGAPGVTPATSIWTLWVTPNPSSGEASLRFSVPSATEGAVSIYSADGRLERVLFRGMMGPGISSLPLAATADAPLASGVHFVKVESPGRSTATRLLIVR